jgi:hypothetical protein
VSGAYCSTHILIPCWGLDEVLQRHATRPRVAFCVLGGLLLIAGAAVQRSKASSRPGIESFSWV